MSDEWKDERYGVALGWANAERYKQEKEPLEALPKGVRHNGAKCPVAEATGYAIGYTTYSSGPLPEDPAGFVPAPVSDFIEAFDIGQYPELIR